MKICIVSDSHDRGPMLAEAVAFAKTEGAEGRQANVKGGKSWLVNPGTVAGLGAPAATWIMADLAAMRFEIRRLTDRPAGATFDTSITA